MVQQPPNLSDLRTPTPFTFTLSAIAAGCDTDPLTLSFSETWLINGTGFPAANPVLVTLTNAAPSSFYAVITFTGITVTSLTPGEPMTLVHQPRIKDISNGSLITLVGPVSCKIYDILYPNISYTVPLTAIPYTPTTTSSPSTSYTTPTSVSTSVSTSVCSS